MGLGGWVEQPGAASGGASRRWQLCYLAVLVHAALVLLLQRLRRPHLQQPDGGEGAVGSHVESRADDLQVSRRGCQVSSGAASQQEWCKVGVGRSKVRATAGWKRRWAVWGTAAMLPAGTPPPSPGAAAGAAPL